MDSCSREKLRMMAVFLKKKEKKERQRERKKKNKKEKRKKRNKQTKGHGEATFVPVKLIWHQQSDKIQRSLCESDQRVLAEAKEIKASPKVFVSFSFLFLMFKIWHFSVVKRFELQSIYEKYHTHKVYHHHHHHYHHQILVHLSWCTHFPMNQEESAPWTNWWAAVRWREPSLQK